MDEFLNKAKQLHIQKTVDNLKNNNMKAYFVNTKQEALELAKTFVKDNDIVSHGGSVTLEECGIIDYLKKNKNISYLDRAKEGITPDQVEEIYRQTFSSDVFFTSSNAITEDGELYNVDGKGNRVSAMIFGPKSVVVIAGMNKIVASRKEAEDRVKNISAPANAIRLKCKTPCAKTGTCMNCKNDYTICCDSVFFSRQRVKDRIKVIIVNEDLGY